MKYTDLIEGGTRVENEVTAAVRRLLAAVENVGKGELKDSQKEIRALASEYPKDRWWLEALAEAIGRRTARR